MAYTTQELIEKKLDRELTQSELDYFNDVLSSAIEVYINGQTQTQFASATPTSIYVSGENSSLLTIPTMFEITAVATVDDDGDESVVDSSSYTVYPRGSANKYAIRNRSGTWDEGFENYKVTGKLGYDVLPLDITNVATEIAANGFSLQASQYKSEKVGEWQVTYADIDTSLSGDSLSVLAGYRRLSRSI